MSKVRDRIKGIQGVRADDTPQKAERRQQIREAMRQTFATAEGRMTLRAIKDFCGYQTTSATANKVTGELLENNKDHNEAMRAVYLMIRSSLNRETLIAVEIDPAPE